MALAVGAAAVVAGSATAALKWDAGMTAQNRQHDAADWLFAGVGTPLSAPATPAPVWGVDSVQVASGLRVSQVPTGDRSNTNPADHLYQNADMIAFWPNDARPEWAIVCIENGPTVPGVQRVKLSGAGRGTVETILTGTAGCDGIRRTPWGTILATEEEDDGNAIEIYRPTETTGVNVNRTAGTASGTHAANVVFRPALGRFAWEGLEVLPNGTVIAGDELRPQKRVNGGAIYKFVSTQAPAGGVDLANPANAPRSPLAVGNLFVLEVGGHTNNRGQGNQTGDGAWIGPINPATARAEAAQKGTGFYRPEDLHLDPIAMQRGEVRACWTNTGVASQGNFGEVLCLNDTPKEGATTGTRPSVQPFIIGNPEMNQPDNLAFQPGTGIAYVIEDTPNIDINGDGTREPHPGEIWACLPDGADRDLLSDGCVRVLSVKTAVPGVDSAEPTGFTFDASGRNAYMVVQHSPDNPATPEDESTTDDMLMISGFEPHKAARLTQPQYGK